MSVIIRLQNLPWSANSFDIRQYFHGLSIPEGGVHIVGGELGDAFIAFSTDEDARQAMMLSGGKLKEVQVTLQLSSRSEMQKVIEAARSMTFPSVHQSMATSATQSVAAQQAPLQSISTLQPAACPQPLKPEVKDKANDDHERKRTRSRSRDRSRRKDNSSNNRRKRSRSRSRDRDRRRRRSRSRSRGRDRYGRDVEKRDEFKKEKSKDKEGGRKDKQSKPTGKEGSQGPGFPAITTPGDPFGLRGAPAQLPFLVDDRLTAAMRSTLSALNLPLPQLGDKNAIPGLEEAGKDPAPARGRYGDPRNGRDVSPGHGGYPDPGPAFGPAPMQQSDLGPVFGNPAAGRNFPVNDMADAWNRSRNDPSMTSLLRGGLNLPNQNPSQVWLNPQVAQNSGVGPMNQLDPSIINRDANRGPAQLNDFNLKDDDFRTRFMGPGPMNDQGRNNDFRPSRGNVDGATNDRGRRDRYSDRQGNDNNERDPSRFERHPRHFNESPFDRDRPHEGRPVFMGPAEPPNERFNERRQDFRSPSGRHGDHETDGRERGPRTKGLCVELMNCPVCPYKDIRQAFSAARIPIDEIKFCMNERGRRVTLRLVDWEGKNLAMKMSDKIRVGDSYVAVLHLPDEEFEAIHSNRGRLNDDDFRTHSRFREEFNEPRGHPRWNRHDRSREDDSYDDRQDDYDRNDRQDNDSNGHHGDMQKRGPLEKHRDGPTRLENGVNESKCDCVLVTNLPPGSTDRDVIDFFSDIGLTPRKLHLMLDDCGEPSGEAYVEFWFPEQAKLACSKSGAPMGRVNLKVVLVERVQMLEAVGLEPEEELEPSNVSLPPQQWRPGRRPLLAEPRPLLGPAPPLVPPGPDPECVVTMSNIPYRAGVDEIMGFLGPSFRIGPHNVFRKMNERGQPSSEARVVMPTPLDAARAVTMLAGQTIRDRPITLRILKHVLQEG